MKKPKEVRIIVAGLSGVGKSTLLQIITEALAKKGFPVEVNTHEYENPIVVTEMQDKRVMALKGDGKKPKVILEERHMYASIIRKNEFEIRGVKK